VRESVDAMRDAFSCLVVVSRFGDQRKSTESTRKHRVYKKAPSLQEAKRPTNGGLTLKTLGLHPQDLIRGELDSIIPDNIILRGA
jgi:hypothetical protein